MKAFRAAIEVRDHEAAEALLAEHVTFHSPVAFAPYEGRPLVAAIVRGAGRVFEDFQYVREIDPDDSPDSALVFRARIGDLTVHGCDFLHVDDDGLIDEFTVMLRPRSAVAAMAEAMGAQFEQIRDEAAAAMAGGR